MGCRLRTRDHSTRRSSWTAVQTQASTPGTMQGSRSTAGTQARSTRALRLRLANPGRACAACSTSAQVATSPAQCSPTEAVSFAGEAIPTGSRVGERLGLLRPFLAKSWSRRGCRSPESIRSPAELVTCVRGTAPGYSAGASAEVVRLGMVGRMSTTQPRRRLETGQAPSLRQCSRGAGRAALG